MERKTLYRLLLPFVLILAVIYTLGLVGRVPFSVSYYITVFFIFLFIFLRWEERLRK